MHLRVPGYTLWGCAIALAVATGPALAAPGDAADTRDVPAANSIQQTQAPSKPNRGAARQAKTVDLLPVDELIGRDVVTEEGEQVGKLQFVTVDLDQGVISHLIVDTSGTDFAVGAFAVGAFAAGAESSPSSSSSGATETGRIASGTSGTPQSSSAAGQPRAPQTARIASGTGQAKGTSVTGDAQAQSTGHQASSGPGSLLIVPWDVASLDTRDDRVVIAATKQLITNAPRLRRSQFNELTEPTTATYMVKYWAPASEMASLERRHRDEGSQGPPRTPSPTGGSSAHSHQDTTSQPQTPAASQRKANQSASAGAPLSTGGPKHHVVLVGSELVAEVTPPMYQLSKQLRGASVVDRKGDDLGQIHRIMVDARTGDAAFAIVTGGPAGQAPVPLQALEWTTDRSTLLTADPHALRRDRALTAHAGEVSRRQLAKLYQRFDTEPYWPQDDGSPTPRGQAPAAADNGGEIR